MEYENWKAGVFALISQDTRLPPWLDDLLPCPGNFNYLDPSTEFFSYCFTTLVDAVASAVLLLPLLRGTLRYRSYERGPTSAAGGLALLAALILPLLRLTTYFLATSAPSPSEWLILAVQACAALLQYVEEGRVPVFTAELLLFWTTTVAVSLSYAVDAVVRSTSTIGTDILAAGISLLGLVSCVTYSGQKDVLGYDGVTFFGRISVNYMSPLLVKGSKSKISREDFPAPPLGLNAVNAYDQLAAKLELYSTSSKYRLLLSLLSVMRTKVFGLLVLDLSSDMCTYARPLALAYFLKSLTLFQLGQVPIFNSVYFGILTGCLPLISAALSNLIILLDSFIFSSSRTALMGLIYRKALRLGPESREEYDSAKIMSLINVDTDMIDDVVTQLPTLISAPVALVVATWQLYLFIGKTMFAAVPLYLIFLPYSTFVSRFLYAMLPETMKIRDDRVKTTSDAFRNIKSLKLYAWEVPFYERIAAIRVDRELKLQRKFRALMSVLQTLWTTMGDFVAAAIFITFLYFKQGTLTPEIVFPCLGLLAYVTMPFMSLPMAITSLGKAFVSQTRINDFLLQPEQDSNNYYRLPASSGFSEESVVCENMTASWSDDSDDKDVALKDINFSATNGDLLCVTGRVGSGKTAFLKTICDEMKILSGSVIVKGSIAYCPQDPWLQNKTLKDNILFGKKFDEAFYQRTLEACALTKDIEQLPKGDETDVGERGISLSGGQKARVALARAVYSRSDIYLLDDVLSAVDEHVAAHLIDQLLGKDGLLSAKTIILATNSVKVLSHASTILALQDKRVVEKLSFVEALEKKDNSIIYRLVKEFGSGEDLENVIVDSRKDHVSGTTTPSFSRRASIDHSKPSLLKGHEEEEEDKGAVPMSMFKRYFDAAGKGVLVGCTVVMVASVVVTNLISVWLGVLSNQNLETLAQGKFYVVVYIALAVSSALSIFASIFWFVGTVSINVSRVLHNEMLFNVMRAPMQFFDVTPLGRIINRFTGDIEKLDGTLPSMLYYFVRSIMNTIMCALTTLIVAPFVIVVIIPLAFLANYYRSIYVPASRQISRMASAANSPILAHIEESVKGSAVVRAFDRSHQFIEIYEHRANHWIELNFLKQSVRSWLSWRIQVMTSLLDMTSILVLIVLIYKNMLSVGFVGVAMYNSSRAGLMVKQVIFVWADLEVSGVALDRILEYVDIEQEAPAHVPGEPARDSWPENGTVKFSDFSTRYGNDSADVLKNLNFSIGNTEKIGIVGRTGSGKSTLTLALFRIIEASNGHIDIDQVNTSKLGLTDLRSKLSIIPQDAQIFGGTLRENIDPFTRYDDTRLWQVLDMCHLKDHFINLGTGLDTMLTEGGGNLSRGQAQLICLGRALLSDTKILVLDEATASVDVETDKVVQDTIRTEFKDRTIITIAHRLNTIMDSDKILVLDQGVVVEYDAPESLLKAKGAFYNLKNAGELATQS